MSHIFNSVNAEGILQMYPAENNGWNGDASSLVNVTIGPNVESIPDSSFQNCPNLTSVTIGNSVTSIRKWAFKNCTSLTSIEIPNSVTEIGEEAFRTCSSLTSIIISESVTSIGYWAFYECLQASIILLKGETGEALDLSIGGIGFTQAQVDNKEIITVNTLNYNISGVLQLVAHADNGDWGGDKSELKVVRIGPDVSSIVPQTSSQEPPTHFSGCTNLISITIPNSMTSIGDHAFYNCGSLTSIIIPESVTSLGASVLANCFLLTSIKLPDSITSIGENAFWSCDSLTSVTLPTNDEFKTLSRYIFEDTPITSVTLPNSLTNIEDFAFLNCTSLTSIEIPDSVTSIGLAFKGCSNLTSVTLPNSLIRLTSTNNVGAFDGCTSLTSIEIPNSVTSIGERAMRNSKFRTITFAPQSTLEEIGDYCFEDSTNLTSITLPNSVTSIGPSAFRGCTSLTSIEIPDSVSSIGTFTFYNCINLISITIPDSVTLIDSQVFNYCTSLTSIEIPDSVTSINHYAFFGCTSLTSVTLPTNDAYWLLYTGLFRGCTSLTSIEIPDSVKVINNYAFYQSGLEEITIPRSVTRISSYAFKYCSNLTSVTIPNSVTEIGVQSFTGCTNLTSVKIVKTNLSKSVSGALQKIDLSSLSLTTTMGFTSEQLDNVQIIDVEVEPTGSLLVSGTPKSSYTLTSTSSINDTNVSGNLTLSYQWKRGDNNTFGSYISGATQSTYTLTSDDVGQQVFVSVSYTDDTGFYKVVNSSYETIGAPSISLNYVEPLKENDSLEIVTDLLGTLTYVWEAPFDVPGQPSDGEFEHGAWSNDNTRLTSEISNNGTVFLEAGQYYHSLDIANSTPTEFRYTWDDNTYYYWIFKTDGTFTHINNVIPSGTHNLTFNGIYTQWNNISGATQSTYTLSQSDVDNGINLRGTVSTDIVGVNSISSDPVSSAVEDVKNPPTGEVQLYNDTPSLPNDGQFEHGAWWNNNTRLTSEISNNGTVFLERGEYVHNLDTANSTSTEFRYLWDDNTDAYWIFKADGTFTHSNNRIPSGTHNLNLTFGVIVSNLLTATNTLQDADGPENLTLSYQWKRGDNNTSGTNISGATQSTYRLTDADVGENIFCTVSYNDAQGDPEEKSSASVGPVQGITMQLIGTPAEDQELSAVLNNVADGLIDRYEWKRTKDDVDTIIQIYVPDESKITLNQSEVGHIISCTIYFNISGIGPISASKTTAVANVNDAPSGAVKIEGTVEVHSEDTAIVSNLLTATNTLQDEDGMEGVTLSYQWKYGNINTSATNISGATESTYRLTDVDIGKNIFFTVSYTDNQGTAEEKSSASVGPVQRMTMQVKPGLTPEEDQELSAILDTSYDTNYIDIDRYEWTRDTDPTVIYTSEKVTLVQSDVGHIISCKVYFNNPGIGPISASTERAVTNVNDAPSGVVEIEGTGAVSNVLTATNTLQDEDGMEGVTLSYQWKRGNNNTSATNISGATQNTYRLIDADGGENILCTVSYTDEYGYDEISNTAAVAVESLSLQVQGTPAEDQTLSAVLNNVADSVIDKYEWTRDSDPTVIYTSEKVTLAQSDVGHTISCKVYFNISGIGPISASTSSAVTNINDAPSGVVEIEGTVVVSNLLTATNTLQDEDGPENLTLSYQWKRGDNNTSGTNISDATQSTYRLTDADVGENIFCTVSYTDNQGTAEEKSSAPVGPVQRMTISISGTPAEDQELSAVLSGHDANYVLIHEYEWTRTKDGEDTIIQIYVPDESKITLNQSEVGHTISCTIYFNNPGIDPVSASTSAVANVNDAPSGDIYINGKVVVSNVLTVKTDKLQDADGMVDVTLSYQWKYGNNTSATNIPDATQSTYRLTDVDVGKNIFCTVSYTDNQGTAEEKSSASVGPVQRMTMQVKPGLTPEKGQELSAILDTSYDTNYIVIDKYEWTRDTDPTVIYESEKVTLVMSDVGHIISCKVYFNNPGIGPISASTERAVVNVDLHAAVGGITISGQFIESYELTATNNITDADGPENLGVSYQWKRGDNNTSGTNIPGATESTYRLTHADVGYRITAKATYTDNGGTTTTVTNINNSSQVYSIQAASVSITGTPIEFNKLSVVTNLQGNLTYKWMRGNDTTEIGNAVDYILTPDDVGSVIKCSVQTDLINHEYVATSSQSTQSAPNESLTLQQLKDIKEIARQCGVTSMGTVINGADVTLSIPIATFTNLQTTLQGIRDRLSALEGQ